MTKIKLQNFVQGTITEAIPASGDFDVALSGGATPTETKGFMIFDYATSREVVYFDNRIGSRIYVKAENRFGPAAHSIGATAQINNVAEFANYLSDNSNTFGYVEKKGLLAVTVWAGNIRYNATESTISDTNLTLPASQTNYIYLDYATLTIKQTINIGTVVSDGMLLATVITSASSVSSISYTKPLIDTFRGVDGTSITFDANGKLKAINSGGGTVTSVTSANTDIAIVDPTTTPVLTLNSGTTANKILKLNGSAQIPAVDGSLLTGVAKGSGTADGTNTGDQNLFSTIAVSGQSNVVADSTSDTLTLVAGSNVTITTNATTDTVTISATGGGGSGTVDTIVAGNGIVVDATDPANPIVSSSYFGNTTYVFSGVNSDIGGYESMVSLPSYTAGALATSAQTVTTTPTILATFATNVGFPNTTAIPVGILTLHIETEKAAGANNYYSYAEIYKRASGGTETLLLTTDISSQTAVNTVVSTNLSVVNPSLITLLSTDRILVKVYAVMLSSSATITLRYDDSTDARLELPAATVDATNFVPYTGATQNLNLGNNTLTTGPITVSAIPYNPGTVSVTGTAVTGTSTEFTKTFKTGDSITTTTSSGSETREINSITSNTVMATVSAFAGTSTNTAYTSSNTGVQLVVQPNGNIRPYGSPGSTTTTVNDWINKSNTVNITGNQQLCTLRDETTINQTVGATGNVNTFVCLTKINATGTGTFGAVRGFNSAPTVLSTNTGNITTIAPLLSATQIQSGATGTITNSIGALINPLNASTTNTVTNQYGVQIAPTQNGGTLTNYAGTAIAAKPTAATNSTLMLLNTTTIPTGTFGIYNTSTADNYFAGNIGLGVTSPTATLHLKAGTATAGTAPIKLATGTALTTPEDGAIEYHTSHLYFTIGGTRYQLDQQAGSTFNGAVVRTDTSTTTSTTEAAVAFTGEDLDTSSYHDNSTNNSRFTIPTTGKYRVMYEGMVFLNTSADYIFYYKIRKNGSTTVNFRYISSGVTATTKVFDIESVASFTAGDYVELTLQTNSASLTATVNPEGTAQYATKGNIQYLGS